MTADDPEKRLGRLKAMQAKFHARQAELDLAPEEERAPRAPVLQKILEHLSGDDGQIDPRKTRMFLTYVRKQIADPEAPRHDLAKRLAEKLQKIPEAQRRRFLATAGINEDASFDFTAQPHEQSRRSPGGGFGGAGRGAGQWGKPGSTDPASDDWLENLFDNL